MIMMRATASDHDVPSASASDAAADADASVERGSPPPTEGSASAAPDEREHLDDPLLLPQSTHTLLFTHPVASAPFAFALGIILLSYSCLFLVQSQTSRQGWQLENLAPVNVMREVRAAQYMAIFITLLMEEEIPTGFYLLRKIPKQSFHNRFPHFKYWKFVFSCGVRIFSGYLFYLNVMIVLIGSSEVLEIFYNVLALQFVQQIDDIAFALAKMDILGKGMTRACTAKCFQTEFDRRKFKLQKGMSIFIKALYAVNMLLLLSWMTFVAVQQKRGNLQCHSITVDLGSEVWEEAVVKMSPAQYEKWLSLYPYYKGDVAATDRWDLAFSSFNGVYDLESTDESGYPIYSEMRKFNSKNNYQVLTPAKIKYCRGIRAWVLTHDYIQKNTQQDEMGCNWLLRSEETTEYDLTKVDTTWRIWNGVVGNTMVSYTCNRCNAKTDCNYNGNCDDNGECVCTVNDNIKYLGTHCEHKFKKECETIIGEADNRTFSINYVDSARTQIVQQYGRPIYSQVNTSDHVALRYTGDRWYVMTFPSTEFDWLAQDRFLSIQETHAFWGRDYDERFTKLVSDESKKPTPVGADFYLIGERGDQFGPSGALEPIQVNKQVGRGYFRCGGPASFLGNQSVSEIMQEKQKQENR